MEHQNLMCLYKSDLPARKARALGRRRKSQHFSSKIVMEIHFPSRLSKKSGMKRSN